MIKMPQITFCIPSKSNLRYLKWAVKSIRDNASRTDHIISVFIDSDTDGTVDWCKEYNKTDSNFKYYMNPNWPRELYGIGKAYDYLIENSETDIVMVYHADMYLCPDADKFAFNELRENTIICSTRIEPPLHPEGPEKIVKDFGMWPEKDVDQGFKEDELIEFVNNNKKDYITNGAFAPWMVNKKEYLEIFGGHDPIMKSAREDSDIFNRMVLAGWDLKQSWSSFVYHLTCRGGQFQHGKLTTDPTQKSEEWQQLMENSTRDFVRKWRTLPNHDEYMYPIIAPVYDITFVMKNCNSTVLKLIEPYASRVYIEDKSLRQSYIHSEQFNSSYNLSERVLVKKDPVELYEGDIIVEFDVKLLTNTYGKILTIMTQMIKESGLIGNMEYEIFDIEIRIINDLKNKLIKV